MEELEIADSVKKHKNITRRTQQMNKHYRWLTAVNHWL